MTESAAAIAPYLESDYWDGDKLGTPEQAVPAPKVSELAAARGFAYAALCSVLPKLDLSEPLNDVPGALPVGTIFNVHDYDPGTVFAYREETLRTVDWSIRPHPPSNPASCQLVSAESWVTRRLQPDLRAHSTPLDDILLTAGRLEYTSQTRWGVAAGISQPSSRFETIPADQMYQDSRGRVRSGRHFTAVRGGEFVLGATSHHVSFHPQTGMYQDERLVRVNNLAVVGALETPDSRLRRLGRRLHITTPSAKRQSKAVS